VLSLIQAKPIVDELSKLRERFQYFPEQIDLKKKEEEGKEGGEEGEGGYWFSGEEDDEKRGGIEKRKFECFSSCITSLWGVFVSG